MMAQSPSREQWEWLRLFPLFFMLALFFKPCINDNKLRKYLSIKVLGTECLTWATGTSTTLTRPYFLNPVLWVT